MDSMTNEFLMLEQEGLKASEELYAQYKREYDDALNRKGMCKFMPENERRSVMHELLNHMSSALDAIKYYEEQIALIKEL